MRNLLIKEYNLGDKVVLCKQFCGGGVTFSSERKCNKSKRLNYIIITENIKAVL